MIRGAGRQVRLVIEPGRVPELVSGAIPGVTESLYGVMPLIALLLPVCGFFIEATVLIMR